MSDGCVPDVCLGSSGRTGSVAFVVTTLARGGTERQVVRVATALRARGWRVGVFFLTGSDALKRELVAVGVDVERIGVDGLAGIGPTLVRLVRALRARKVDSLVTMLFHADVLGSAAHGLVGKPRLIRSVRSTATGTPVRRIAWRLTRDRVDWSVANSTATLAANVAAGVIDGSRAGIIPNAIDMSEFVKDPVARETARRAMGILPREFIWVAVGAQREEKSYGQLVRAFAGLPQPDCRLLIAGTKWQGDPLDRLARELNLGGRFCQLGDVDDVPGLLAAADGLVLASRFEGMPNSVLEGMAAGLPIVTTDVGGVRELVDESVGRIVAVGDGMALTAAMAEILQIHPDERRAMGERARERIQAACGVDSVADRWEAVLRGLSDAR